MKVNLIESKRSISNIRSQIKDVADLKKFDQFLEGKTVFDPSNEGDATSARKSCSGKNCCREITIGVGLS